MKTLSMLLAACAGLTAVQGYAQTNEYPISMLGRYAVYDLQLKGKGLDVLEDKGKYSSSYIYTANSVSETYDAVGIGKRSAKGIVVEDMSDPDIGTFILFEKGGYAIMAVDIDRDSILVVNKMEESPSKFSASGVRAIEFEIYGEEVEIYSSVIGRFAVSVSEGESEEAESYKLSYVASGVAGVEEYPSSWTNADFIAVLSEEEYLPAYANQVKVKYNSKLSAQLVEAYESADNDAAGIEAVEELLSRYIEKKAKVNGVDFSFSSWDM